MAGFFYEFRQLTSFDMTQLKRILVATASLVLSAYLTGCSNSSGTSSTTTVTTAIAGLALDSGFATLYVANANAHIVQSVFLSGPTVTTLAGAAGQAGTAEGTTTASAGRFNEPVGITRFGAGTDLYVADTLNHGIRKLTAAGVISNVAGNLGTAGNADHSGSNASFYYPKGITNDGTDLYVADTFNHTIRKVTIGGVVTTIAGYAGSPGSTDATGSNARFRYPYGIVSDGTDLYVSDSGNNLIRKVTTGGVVTLLAGSSTTAGHVNGNRLTAATFNAPAGIAIDGNKVYVADSGSHLIRLIDLGTNLVSTIAGIAGTAGNANGPGTTATFSTPTGLALDTVNDVLYVSDQNFTKVRKIDLTTTPVTVTTLNASF